jgi:hypothetical protein
MSTPFTRSRKPLTVLAGSAAAALAIGWAGTAAQASDPVPLQQQASLSETAATANPEPLGRDDVREVQNQLIALGFDPGAADGEVGPATMAAAQQYDQKHGGSGQVSIDNAFLARLKADSGPRLSYEQVAERSRARQTAHTSSASASSSSGAGQLGGIVQQIAPLIGAAIANSNNNNNTYYRPGYYAPGPGYYGPPPPGYYSQGYGYRGW